MDAFEFKTTYIILLLWHSTIRFFVGQKKQFLWYFTEHL